jgi:hypothetical protein
MSLCSLGICVPYTNVCIRGIQSLVEGRLKTQASSVGSKVFRGVTSMCYPDRPLLWEFPSPFISQGGGDPVTRPLDGARLCSIVLLVTFVLERKEFLVLSSCCIVMVVRDIVRSCLALQIHPFGHGWSWHGHPILGQYVFLEWSIEPAPVAKGDKLGNDMGPRNQYVINQMKSAPYSSTVRRIMYAQICTRHNSAFITGMLGIF